MTNNQNKEMMIELVFDSDEFHHRGYQWCKNMVERAINNTDGELTPLLAINLLEGEFGLTTLIDQFETKYLEGDNPHALNEVYDLISDEYYMPTPHSIAEFQKCIDRTPVTIPCDSTEDYRQCSILTLYTQILRDDFNITFEDDTYLSKYL